MGWSKLKEGVVQFRISVVLRIKWLYQYGIVTLMENGIGCLQIYIAWFEIKTTGVIYFKPFC